MRVCGGWVRDKLLQKDNDDIDICIDTCSGQEFTSELKTWYDSRGAASLCSTVGVIKASSEKSKHLETAVVRITVTGQDVPPGTVVSLDFVQLRSETYADDSRVPVAKAATAEEDAMRRDFTINAMYDQRAPQAPPPAFESNQARNAFLLSIAFVISSGQVLQHSKRDC
jgi:tRNA nucleotidyltransferase (CCA-adding enzyme)